MSGLLRNAVVVLTFALCSFTISAEPKVPPQLDDFLGDYDFWNAELSPNGRYLAGLRRHDGKDYIITVDLDADEMEIVPTLLGDYFVNWLEWVTDDRLVASISGYQDWDTGRLITRAELKTDMTGLLPARFTRLVSIERQTKKSVAMFADDRAMMRNFSLGRVTDFLPGDPDHILMPARMRGDLDLFKVNLVDGSFERIATGTQYTYRWYTDRNGEPAFRLNTNSRGTVIYIYAREDRDNGKIKWRKTKTIRLNRNEQSKASAEFEILYPGPSGTTYYVAARPEGANTTGIYLYDFEKDEMLETIRTHESLDIEDAFFNRDTREFLGVYYYKDRLVIEMEDETIQAHLNGLNAYFDDKANVLPIDSSDDGNRWLVFASGPLDLGSYHVYDVDKAYARLIGYSKLSLSNTQNANVELVEFKARDGLSLKGYLTRPANARPDDRPPLIMMPHGGPESRDYYQFDWRAQVLASQGYQVFQPNFRGSSGFGKAFAEMGRRQWGKAMQTDVEDAYSHLVEVGVADPGNACIFGESYGGYAALAAATLTPDTYKCVIASAGPSELVKMLKWERKEEGSDSETYDYWVKQIGDPKRDRDELEASSPARMADRVKVPVLLIHGKNDGVVPIEQSELMEKAMKKAEKDVRFVRLEESGHTYRSDEDEEREYLEILNFLARHLPVSESPPNTTEIANEQIATSVPAGAEPVE